MNSLNDLLPFLIAKQELKRNGINSTPIALLTGLMPGMKAPLLQQFILNKTIVDGEIENHRQNEAIAKLQSARLSSGTGDTAGRSVSTPTNGTLKGPRGRKAAKKPSHS